MEQFEIKIIIGCAIIKYWSDRYILCLIGFSLDINVEIERSNLRMRIIILKYY